MALKLTFFKGKVPLFLALIVRVLNPILDFPMLEPAVTALHHRVTEGFPSGRVPLPDADTNQELLKKFGKKSRAARRRSAASVDQEDGAISDSGSQSVQPFALDPYILSPVPRRARVSMICSCTGRGENL